LGASDAPKAAFGASRRRSDLRVDAAGRVRHRISRAELSNDLAGWLGDLVADGLLDPSAFEEAFVAVVREVDPDWTAFYRNTCAALAAGGEPGGTNAGIAPVHERAAALTLGPHVLELGCCFGFLSLRLAAEGHRVTAVDLVPGTARLLASVAAALGSSIATLAGDARRIPLATGSADTVHAVHLLEHLPRGVDAVVLAEMLRVARRRVVVAVPFEDVPNAAWGHVRTYRLADLDALGAATGLPYVVEEHHGGWLVVEQGGAPATPGPRGTTAGTGTARGARPSTATTTAPAADSAAAPRSATSKPCSRTVVGAVGAASTAVMVTPSAEPT
jgi:SAM-dependent methyltransferase